MSDIENESIAFAVRTFMLWHEAESLIADLTTDFPPVEFVASRCAAGLRYQTTPLAYWVNWWN